MASVSFNSLQLVELITDRFKERVFSKISSFVFARFTNKAIFSSFRCCVRGGSGFVFEPRISCRPLGGYLLSSLVRVRCFRESRDFSRDSQEPLFRLGCSPSSNAPK